MQLNIIAANEAGQRLDKYLKKFMPEAPNSFFCKMLRKKNITLNEKKAEANVKILEGDEIRFFLAEETIAKFRGLTIKEPNYSQYSEAYECYKNQIKVIFENNHIIIFDKPAGVLSQKAKIEDISINEYLIGYLLESKSITKDELLTFKPSICNRLDRNTSGLVICGKSLIGLQEMGHLIKNREFHKYYRCVVTGNMKDQKQLDGYLFKNEKTNKVTITKEQIKDSTPILTKYKPINHYNKTLQLEEKLITEKTLYKSTFQEGTLITGKNYKKATLLEVELITGKTHQIRAHLASINHAIIGDFKYGNKKYNELYRKKYGITHQLLHAYRLEFKEMPKALEDMKNLTLLAPMPKIYDTDFS